MPRRGFTLIELLVVITIVAILAALMMPAIRMVRDRVRCIQCMSNLRNLAMATNVFCENNDGRFPGGGQQTGSVEWPDILNTEILSQEKVNVARFGSSRSLNCPSFKQSATSFRRPYAMNFYLAGGDPSSSSTFYGLYLTNPQEKGAAYINYYLGMHHAKVSRPSEVMLLQDAETNTSKVREVSPTYETNPATCWSYAPSAIKQGMLGNGGQCAFRHGVMPSIYADLHGDMREPAPNLNSLARYFVAR